MGSHDQLGLPHAAFNQTAFEDPYLSGPSDLEENFLEHHTPSASSVDHSSVSPAENQHASDEPNPHRVNSFDKFVDYDQPFFLMNDMLSGAGDHIDSGSPNADSHMYVEIDDNQTASSQLPGYALAQPSLVADVTEPQQPNLMSAGISQANQPPRLEIPDSSNDAVNHYGPSIPSPSPVVKVSQVHRGDSPTRDDDEWTRRRSNSKRSSAHLSSESPGDLDEFNNDHETSDIKQDSSPSRAGDGSWIPDTATGQTGLSPDSRNNEFGPSPKDMEEERQRAEKDFDIRVWSASVSAANSEAGDESAPYEQPRSRPRATSAVETRHDYFSLMQPDDSRIPGPGQLIYEPEPGSDFDASSETSRSESLDGLPPIEIAIPNFHSLNRTYPWKDRPEFPLPLPLPVELKTQPDSSRAAMQLYEDLTKKLETASRVGTWGSKPLNDAEVDSLLESDSFFKTLSISKASIRKFLQRGSSRGSSNSKDKKSHPQKLSRQSSLEPDTNNHGHKRESSISSKLSRATSLNRSKAPTGIMAAAIAGQIVAGIGSSANQSVSPRASLSPAPWNRSRSKSEGTGPLPDLKPLTITNLGQKQSSSQTASPMVAPALSIGADGEDDEDDDSGDEKGVFMPLAPSSQQIVPTFEGFKRQISLLDPRLEPALVDRFAREQLRRYKKLIDDYDKHTALVQGGACNHDRCFASGGRAKLLPPRANAKDPKANYCQFQIPGHEHSEDEDGYDEDSDKSMDNSVMPAVFAEGIRLPPVKRLPAEFECTLCFKVKKFQKPSDWTKHIFEDICPFTCTFPNCNEPKSFKRKADWVRHETERHRHLEWWACNESKCEHICYRKNNFVQHLVREHGKPDPTAKKDKSTAGRSANSNDKLKEEIDKLWNQVEGCRHVTTERPENEPCRFCGNISKDWRKLMAHLARHMERIALPVLHLVEEYSSSANNKPMNIYKPTTPTTPSISIYGSADAITASNSHVAGIVQPTITTDTQPMMTYPTQQVSHMLSPVAVNPSGTTYPPVSPSYLQPHYTPVHRNSMSYPPSPTPHSMATRQATTVSNIGPMPGANSFGLSVSTMGIAGPQQTLYQSPQDTCVYPDDFIPTTYANTPMANYPITASPEENDPTNTRAYFTQMQDNSYQSAAYNFQ